MAEGEQVLSSAISGTAQLATEAMKILAAAIRALIKETLIDDVLLKRTSADYRLKKEQLKDMLQEKHYEDVRTSSGWFKNFAELEKANVPMVGLGVTLTDEQMKTLGTLCKREGVLITGVRNKEKNADGQRTYYLYTRESDMERLADIVDLMNLDERISGIDKSIESIEKESKDLQKELDNLNDKVERGEPLTAEEKKRKIELEDKLAENKELVNELKAEAIKIEADKVQTYNNLRTGAIYQQAANGDVPLDKKPMDFNAAVNRITDKQLKRNLTYYLCDMDNSDNYIKCEAKNAMFNGKQYIKTEYTVFVDGKEALKCDDARFEGKTVEDWYEIRESMRSTGNFSDNIVRCQNLNELKAYQQQCKKLDEQTKAEMGGFEQGQPNRDYGTIIQNLSEKLKENGYSYRDGIAVNMNTGKNAEVTSSMPNSRKAKAAESIIVAKQMKNYSELNRVESELNLARVKLMALPEMMSQLPQNQNLKAEVEKLGKEYEELLKEEESLGKEMKRINSAKAVDLTKESLEQEKQEKSVESRESVEQEYEEQRNNQLEQQVEQEFYNDYDDNYWQSLYDNEPEEFEQSMEQDFANDVDYGDAEKITVAEAENIAKEDSKALKAEHSQQAQGGERAVQNSKGKSDRAG